MKDYYNANDVKIITECSKSMAYEIIRRLKESFEKKYPEAITIQGKIPRWYFEEVMKNKKREEQ